MLRFGWAGVPGLQGEDMTMASNFRVLIHQNGDNLHLKLIGDFDTTSASQLIEILTRGRRGASRIFIHTATLREIHPFGARMFREDLASRITDPDPLVFTGEGAAVLAPS
jgi:hypothetical protein